VPEKTLGEKDKEDQKGGKFHGERSSSYYLMAGQSLGLSAFTKLQGFAQEGSNKKTRQNQLRRPG